MDKRKMRSRSGLHRNLQSEGSSESREEELPSETLSRQKGSQKLSNTEILRRKTSSSAKMPENIVSSTPKEKPASPFATPTKNITKPVESPLRKRVAAKSSDPVSVDNDVDKIMEDVLSPLSKRQKIMSIAAEEEEFEAEKQPEKEKLLSKRKRFAGPTSDSDSEQENVAAPISPLKLRRVDPRVVSQRVESQRTPEKTSTQQSSRFQLGKAPISGRSNHSLRKNPSQRESNSSILKKLATPPKANQSERDEIQDDPTSPETRGRGNKLEDFFRRSGVTLAENDEPHKLDDDPPMIEKKMIELFATGRFKKEDITDLWNVYINDDANLKKALNDVIVNSSKSTSTSAGCTVSLIRIMLQIPVLQTVIADHLLQKLNEAVLIADSMEDVPWSPLLLQQFRFLEIVVDTDSLTTRLDELLETCPIWFQRELILFLPDIVIDVQHHAIAEMLSKLMESHTDLTSVVLDCITNLTLGKEYLEELRDKILTMLKNNMDIGRIPPMARFVLNACPNVEICEKTLGVIRSLDMQPLSGEKSEEYFTNQTLLVGALQMSILMSKTMSKAARNIVKKTSEPAKPLDLIILLIVHTDKTVKKNAETVLKSHVKCGFYRPSLIASLYKDYKEVAKDFQPDALQLASSLLKSEDRCYADFAIEWFRHQFVSQADTMYKQREIISKIILLMGNNDQTAKGALDILRRITENEEEMRYLQEHCNHLRILLGKIENFDLQEVATLSDLLYALCTSSDSRSEALQDDLFILMQKQLSNGKTLSKCKGVLGAAMAIKHLAGKPESCKIAVDLIAKVRAGVKNCPRSQALFYDQIGSVIADTKKIEPSFLELITNKFQDEFVNTYITDLEDYRGELVPKFGLNDPEFEPQKCVIHFGDGRYGAVVPAFFRLLRICFMRLKNGNLEDINVLLGCPVLVPKDMDIPETWILDLTICCINWFRELISGFVTQTDSVLQEQVLTRLDNLMTLQGEFSTMLTMSDSRYQPPPCYYHVFPAPAFVKVEKKVSKKGKRGSVDKSASVSVPEWESWEIGSSLCSKNTTYFRRMDAGVVDLLDLKMEEQMTQAPKQISKAQICFLIKELLGMFEGGKASESFMRDLIQLLPKICSQLKDIVAKLREKDDTIDRHAVILILSLLTTMFDWSGFKSAKYHSLLRDGLRTLASQSDKANLMLRSAKELVGESYKYFESLNDIATDISLAFAIVKMCRSLMKHSDTYTSQCKNKQANLASGFLSLQWPDDKASGAAYKTAVVGFLANWIDNEPNPLETVTTVLEWLPDEVAKLEKPLDRLERLPAVTKAIFHNMFQRLFEGLINGVKISCAEAKTDPERIKVWQKVGTNVQKIVQICKNSSRAVLLPFLRSMTSLLRLFLTTGMPIMEQNLRFQTEEVTGIMKMMQGGTRYLNMVCVDSTEKKDITLAKVIPPAKQLIEKLLYLVKGMLVFNNSSEAFWMGNLVNKNLEGQQVLSQSSEEPTVTSRESSVVNDSDDEARSEILQSDVEEQMSDEDS